MAKSDVDIVVIGSGAGWADGRPGTGPGRKERARLRAA